MAILEAESTLTDRYQTTVPEPVRRALHLGKRDRLVFKVLDAETVVVTRKSPASEEDPVLGQFLSFLARDMAAHPERIHPVTADLVTRAKELVHGIEVDLDAPLSDDA